MKFSYYDSVGSTQDEAKLAYRTSPENSEIQIFWTQNQTAGRGRQNKKWDNAGTERLLMSLLIPFEKFERRSPQINWGLMPLFSGFQLWRFVRDSLKADNASPNEFRLDLKWPNDLGLIEKKGQDFILFKKLAGILCERVGRQTPSHIIGIGVNLKGSRHPGGELGNYYPLFLDEVTSSHLISQPQELLKSWVHFFFYELNEWCKNPLEYEMFFLEELKSQAMKNYWGLKGKSTESVVYKTRDLDESGNLVVQSLEDPSKELHLRAGEFHLLPY